MSHDHNHASDTYCRLDRPQRHGRPHIGANGVSWPPEKTDGKLKSENMQKRAVFYVYDIF